ncbi:hypothetical protein DSCO28_14620 [Desulfosarcina ovata subsp. sediminis]|uniref:Uncharacterized protein n=1 Tax=Desulfosarcina ovata subsp. sediminis TaxID=885957 RepID=A0A5K7ZIR4_9BACT|nr:hypothetical protein [Desulfosarcina ovata]BBO80896.1 hypothetical protein DSCO28_14620 [Desulfosarcina ovata subsp. sediminis]
MTQLLEITVNIKFKRKRWVNKNLKEVIEMLLEDGDPKLEAEFIGTQNVMVA